MLEEGGDIQAFNGREIANYNKDKYDYKGWENIPALFLKMAVINSYWGDLVKAHIINAEFNNVIVENTSLENYDEWKGAAGLITSAIHSSPERNRQEIWYSGYVGAQDLESILEIP